ncbi:MAG: hypothetical protein RLY49_171 [Candidatus Parcubacteria bacterium]|jgi:mRNA interferase MazF
MNEFDNWNKRKKHIHFKNKRMFIKEGEIRWCQLGQNIGFEECGTGKDFDRPVLILKIFSKEICLIVPLTTSAAEHRFRIKINNKSKALLSQIKVVDTKRLSKLMSKISVEELKEIKKAIQGLLE